MMNLTVSLGQMDVLLGDPEANLETVSAMATEAARRGSDLLILPELWSTGYDLANAAQYATPTDSGVFAALADIARGNRLAIVGSSPSLIADGRYGNTAVYFDATGRLLAQYSKTHLFRLMEEDRYLAAGDGPVQVETEWGQAGLAICYDLRFPELFRCYAVGGATVIILPAEWPYPRLSPWRTLLRARAVENQVFVLACNRVGTSKETTFCGHSSIIDPLGETVVEAGDSEMLLTATIDLSMVATAREFMPILKDRRPELYSC